MRTIHKAACCMLLIITFHRAKSNGLGVMVILAERGIETLPIQMDLILS